MKRPQKPKPFDIKLTDEQRVQLGNDLARDIAEAFTARRDVIDPGGLIDLADWFYEQGRSEPQDRPFVGAADLTSYFITENVDAMKARQMQAVYGVRPFCFVEGKGADAKKAATVEEFIDWQVRKSTVKDALAKTILGALIEDCYILEVSEKTETRRLTTKMRAAFELGEGGTPVFADGKPKLKMVDGEPVAAQDGEPHAELEYTTTKTKRLGPKYTPISMKDFVFLPGHAKNADQVWGYAYRFTARLPELKEQVQDGVYDEDAVNALGDSSDTQEEQPASPSADVAPQYDVSVEKELFQLSIKRDFDRDGREEWYIATVSLKAGGVLLRLKLDKFVQKVGRSRCVPFVLFPRRNSVYGYSYSFDKLLTLAEEHTSLRNMKADRSALKTNAPMQQVVGGLWDADAEPFGIGRIIHVRDHNELKPVEVEDVPVSVVEQEHALHQAKERVGGLSDSAVGILSGERRTLGENKLVAGGSAVRVKEVTGYLHAAIADVMLLTHAHWVETLEADPKGIDAPDSVAKSMANRGAELTDGRVTADMIRGDYQFEPYGSDETADPEKRKADFNTGLQALAGLSKAFPMLAAIMNNPETTQAILEQWLRAFDVRDREPFLKAFKAVVAAQAQQPPMVAGQPPMGAPAGAPGGLPPELMAMLSGAGGAPAEGGASGGY